MGKSIHEMEPNPYRDGGNILNDGFGLTRISSELSFIFVGSTAWLALQVGLVNSMDNHYSWHSGIFWKLV